MKYMLMLFDHEDWWATATDGDVAAEMERHDGFSRYVEDNGMTILRGEAL